MQAPSAATGSPRSSTSSEICRRALTRLLRGRTWQGLAREIAWEAVRSTGVAPSCLDWLARLVEAPLGDAIDGLAGAVEPACRRARSEHLLRWPDDLHGAEAAADAAGLEEAAQILSRVYVEVLDWAVGVLEDRTAAKGRFAPLRRLRARSAVEVPSLVVEELARTAEASEHEAAA